MINYMLFELNLVTSNNNYTSKFFYQKIKLYCSIMIKLINNIVKYKLCLLK